jgi:hypothetical protein
MDMAVARPILEKSKINGILKYGLGELKYWFLASIILVSNLEHEFIDLDSTIASS